MIDFSPRITPDQARALAETVGPMDAVKCSSAIHAGCQRDAEWYIMQVHDCQGLPHSIWPVCNVVIHTLVEHVKAQAAVHCPHCHSYFDPKEFRHAAGHVPGKEPQRD